MYKDREYQELAHKHKPISVTFSFDNIEKLLLAVKRLHNLNYMGESSLHYDEHRGKYYINLENVSIKDLKFAFLEEYSSCIKGVSAYYVKEHFRCICKKEAVKKLSLCSP